MIRNLVLALLILGIGNPQLSLADNEERVIDPPMSVLERAQLIMPDVELRHVETSKQSDGEFMLSSYSYSEFDPTILLGAVYVIWNINTSNPFWGFNVPGAWWHLNVLKWIDLNGDGLNDLFFIVPGEEWDSIQVYLRNGNSLDFSTDNFLLSYSTSFRAYSLIVDLNLDGQPELLEAGYYYDRQSVYALLLCAMADGEVEETFPGQKGKTQPPGLLEIPSEVEKEISKEFTRVTAGFERFNNWPETYAWISAVLFGPFKISQFQNQMALNVTSQFPTQLKWQIHMLKKIRAANPQSCHNLIDSRIAYFSQLLGVTQSSK
ncbi:MAG: VCBS repeat-containing protein [Nitrospira sp.]|nr:VCBS repeat-containing protein [Nitrospira sp.]